MDYCLPSQQIPSYAPSSSGGGTSNLLTTKNIDCVTLESDIVKCSVLTINGNSISQGDVTLLEEKTQNQTGTPGLTSFNGTVDADYINTNSLATNQIDSNGLSTITVSALTCNTTITSKDSINVSNDSVTSLETGLLQSFNSALTTGAQTSLRLGKDVSNCALLTYYGDNSMSLNLQGSSGPTITPTSFSVPNSMYIGSNEVIPRSLGTFQAIQAGSAFREYKFSFVGKTNVKRVIINIVGWRKAVATFTPYIQFSSDNVTYYSNNAATSPYGGTTSGNFGSISLPWISATSGNQLAGIPIFNQINVPASSAGVFNFVTNIELTYTGTYTGLQEQWNVSGMFSTTSNGGTGGTGPYYGVMAGYLRCSESAYPILRAVKMIAADDFIAEGSINVLYY